MRRDASDVSKLTHEELNVQAIDVLGKASILLVALPRLLPQLLP